MLLKTKTQHIYAAGLSFVPGIKELNFEATLLYLSSGMSTSVHMTS